MASQAVQSMTTLREKQKADREKRILSAAVRKFRTDGYKRARIEDIAATAGVSVGTVYNYYGTKGDILIAAVTLEVEEVLAEGRALLEDPPADLCEAILALTFCYYDHSLHYLTKEMWRQAMALAIVAPDTTNGRIYVALDAKLASQVVDLIRRFQLDETISKKIDAEAMGRIIFNSLNQLFVAFVTDETKTLETLRKQASELTVPIAMLLDASSQ